MLTLNTLPPALIGFDLARVLLISFSSARSTQERCRCSWHPSHCIIQVPDLQASLQFKQILVIRLGIRGSTCNTMRRTGQPRFKHRRNRGKFNKLAKTDSLNYKRPYLNQIILNIYATVIDRCLQLTWICTEKELK